MLHKPKLAQLQLSQSTPSLASLSPQSPLPAFEYEDIIYPKNSTVKLTDLLARQSDVTVSNQGTPQPEYRGFALHLLVSLLHTFWLLWTLLPKTWLNKVGIYYYPSRWWSLALSAYLLMSMFFGFLLLLFWNLEMETMALDDLRNICDDDAVLQKDVRKYGWKDTNGVYDLRITDANDVLYG